MLVGGLAVAFRVRCLLSFSMYERCIIRSRQQRVLRNEQAGTGYEAEPSLHGLICYSGD